MKSAALIALIALASSSSSVEAKNPLWNELQGYTFEQFKADFHLQVEPESVEYNTRKALFLSELERVNAHNNNSKVAWKESVTKFSAMTADERRAYFGRSKAHKAAYNLQSPKTKTLKAKEHTNKALSELPASIDWRDMNVVSAVKDQGHCGSCWAFSSTAVIESAVAINSGLLFNLSPEQVAMCAPNPDHCGGTGGCGGSTAELAFDYIANSKGIYEEYQYCYNSYFGQNFACYAPATTPVATLSGYVALESNNYADLMNAVATVGPIAVSVDASTWHAYSSGIFSGCNQASPDINHLVVLVGYGVDNGQKYWTVRNSWSPAWGEKGYIRLARSDNDEQNCGMDTTPQNGSACEGQTEAVKACGTCGVLYDSSYPTGATAV